jgi:hypothetical protein
MKRLIIFIGLFAACNYTFGQALSEQESRFNFFEIGFGGGVPVINNKDFDNWSETNYHSKITHTLEAMGDYFYVARKYDGGFQATGGSDIYGALALYFGRRITSANSPVSSFLNLGVGEFINQVYNYAPLGFQPTADEVGQRMYLQYNAAYVSLQSRNYINSLNFHISRNRRFNFRTGFYVDLNYRPWNGSWQYGYDKKTKEQEYDEDTGYYTVTNTNYSSQKAVGVPDLANAFMDAGVFVSITLNTLKKH